MTVYFFCLLQNDGQTAFHIAAYEGDEGMIKLLSTSSKLSADIQDKVNLMTLT